MRNAGQWGIIPKMCHPWELRKIREESEQPKAQGRSRVERWLGVVERKWPRTHFERSAFQSQEYIFFTDTGMCLAQEKKKKKRVEHFSFGANVRRKTEKYNGCNSLGCKLVFHLGLTRKQRDEWLEVSEEDVVINQWELSLKCQSHYLPSA